MLDKLKQHVCYINFELDKQSMIICTRGRGNISEISIEASTMQESMALIPVIDINKY